MGHTIKKMIRDKGIFTVSLDVELYWGVRDKRTIPQYANNLLGVREAVKEILAAFHDYEIHATWAFVGFLFFPDADILNKNSPARIPHYTNSSLSPYRYINESDKLEAIYHFAPDILDVICGYDNQEIGTHTFSHYYCLERGHDPESFYADISSAMKTAEERGLKIKSLVFPRNQCNREFLPILADLGIKCYRGSGNKWLYRIAGGAGNNRFRRALYLADAYINISGHNTHNLREVLTQKPFNIPSSRFLRPYSKKLLWLEGLRLRRIKKAMSYAAEYNTLFHLWWHPHNFGTNTTENIASLRKVLEHYKMLKEKYGMLSLNMGEIADRIEKTI